MAYGKIKIDTIESSTKTVLVDDIPTPADAAPQPLGVAAIGASTDYAREDHVHAMPSAADVGADPSGTAASAISTHEAAADPHPGYALESSLGTSAVLDVGTTAGTVAAGDRGLSTGGTTGQALVKASNTDYDTQWADVTAVAALDDLTDVTLTSPSDGQVLEYDSATSTWVNATPSGGTPGGSDTQVQYNNAGSFGGSADLTWDDTAKELGIGGDINLDDGGTYTTTVQTVTPTANRTISFPDATGTVALVAGSNGQVTYNNAGSNAGLTSASIGSTGEINISLAGAASTPPVSFTGSWFTGGTGTTTKPQLLIEPTGTTSTAWSTSGTGLGVNAASGFGGRLLDLQTNGTTRFNVQANGVVNALNAVVAAVSVLTDAATITPDLSTSCNYTVTLGGNRTLANPTNIVAGQSGSIFIVQDGTGGRTLAWGSYWDFAGGTAPTLSTGIGAVDRVDYIVRSSTSIHAVFTGNYS